MNDIFQVDYEYGEECKYLIINTSSRNEEYLEIKYCPMCGRRLEVEP